MLFILIPFLLTPVIQSAKILIVVPTPSYSHNLFYQPLIQELSSRGHEIVSVTSDPMHNPNITEIDIHNETYSLLNIGEFFLENVEATPMELIRKMTPKMTTYLNNTLTHPEVVKIFQKSFDLVMVEHYCYPLLFALKSHFKTPLISIMSMEMMLNSYDSVGNPTFPSYFTDLWHEAGDLSFAKRLRNFMYSIEFRMFYAWELVPSQQKLTPAIFGSEIDLMEAERNLDLILVNTNPVFGVGKPLTPNIIEIGGLHSRGTNKLPQDLKQFLDRSSNGVVYFALGSNFKSKSLPNETFHSILQAFRQIPYQVLFKWENDNLPNKPSNVYIHKWLPQQDVLDHANVIAFVTPGGINSIEESIRAKVPMVCFATVATDQKYNAGRVEELGIGKRIYFNEITTGVLVESIREIIENPLYKKKITKIGDQMWDLPMKPLDKAVWWIEYVIRHKGASHLRSPGAFQSWIKLLQLDIISFLFMTALVTIFICAKSLTFISKKRV